MSLVHIQFQFVQCPQRINRGSVVWMKVTIVQQSYAIVLLHYRHCVEYVITSLAFWLENHPSCKFNYWATNKMGSFVAVEAIPILPNLWLYLIKSSNDLTWVSCLILSNVSMPWIWLWWHSMIRSPEAQSFSTTHYSNFMTNVC